jgi:oligogalacturonide transport system permease protein
MQSINAIQNFTSVFVITRGGPLKSTYMLGLKLYNDGFVYWRMGYASATSWIIFTLIMLFTLVLFTSQKYWVFYSDES